MGRRRGFFAELQHQNRLAEREQVRLHKAADRDWKAALREREKALKAEERAQNQLAKAAAAEQKQLEKEAKLAHIESMECQANALNYEIEVIYQEIDSVLSATLEVDDFVDLNDLKNRVIETPFPRIELLEPTPRPTNVEDPIRPRGLMPTKPTGLSGLFGRTKYKEEVKTAERRLRRDLEEWNRQLDDNERRRRRADEEYFHAEDERVKELDHCKKEHERSCLENAQKIDELIGGLGYGTPEAVQDYVSIVLSNSVYPEVMDIEHDFQFDVETAELFLRVYVSSPEMIPHIKAYKYTKSTDQITTTDLNQKARKDRYTGMIHQVGLRSLHEVFEADRRGIIKTISLEVGTDTIVPATGQQAFILFLATGAEREEFMSYNLAAVDPLATLNHMGASVSKNPFGLIPTSAKGVRS